MSAKTVKYKSKVQFTESKIQTRRQSNLSNNLIKDQLEHLPSTPKILSSNSCVNNVSINENGNEIDNISVSDKLTSKSEDKVICAYSDDVKELNQLFAQKINGFNEHEKVELLQLSLKRKRGRPKKTNDVNGILNQNNEKKYKEESLCKEPNKYTSNVKPKRTQRMASLNAMAKVNAVLDNYRLDVYANKLEAALIETIPKNCKSSVESNCKSDSIQTSDFKIEVLDNKKENIDVDNCLVSNSSEHIISEETNMETNSFNQPEKNELKKTISVWKKCGTVDKAIQTDCHHKYVQTDYTHMNDDGKCMQTSCLCRAEQPKAFNHYSPSYKIDSVSASEYPIYMKSTVLAHNQHHSLALPITKKHIFYDGEKSEYKTNDYNNQKVSMLVNQCRRNSFLKHSDLCSKLIYLTESDYLNKPDGVDEKGLQPVVQKSLERNIMNLKSKVNGITQTNSKMTKKMLNKPSKSMAVKVCNGWKFDGECVEENVTIHGEEVTRKYYTSLCRKDETISVHDAVLLQSGARRYNLDYIARISAIWEDTTGVYKDDMMISVFWYYKPEQISGKCAEISIGEMEVFASRHQDDNSVACIVDKCYVITFPQFNRFRAQHKLWRAKYKEKLSVVPENKKQSRLIPSPDIDPSIVFFCRYAYDYRLGRILKS